MRGFASFDVKSVVHEQNISQPVHEELDYTFVKNHYYITWTYIHFVPLSTYKEQMIARVIECNAFCFQRENNQNPSAIFSE